MSIFKVIINVLLKWEKLCRFVCISLDRVWMCGNGILIICVDINGLVGSVVKLICLDFLGDIVVNR